MELCYFYKSLIRIEDWQFWLPVLIRYLQFYCKLNSCDLLFKAGLTRQCSQIVTIIVALQFYL